MHTRTPRTRRAWPLLGVLMCLACGQPDEGRAPSGAPTDLRDAAEDADLGLRFDQGQRADSGPDTTADAGADTGSDTGSGSDTGADSDSGADAGADLGQPGPGQLRGLRAQICGQAVAQALPSPLPQARQIAQEGLLPDGSPRAFNFLEGPVWDARRQRLYFTDMNNATPNRALVEDMFGPPSIIYALDPTSGQITTLSPEGQLRSNGLAIDEQGRLLAAAHDLRQIASLTLDEPRQRGVVAAGFEGKAFNTTNDLVVSSAGRVYFTDPAYNGQLDGRARELDLEGVFVADSDGRVSLIDGRINRPNGITLSVDQTWLYVASRGDNKVYRYPLDARGEAGPREVFLDGPSADGVAIDCAGNLYLALPGKGVEVFSAQGQPLGRVPNTKDVTNAAFGGADHRTLYITEQRALKALTLPNPGLPY